MLECFAGFCDAPSTLKYQTVFTVYSYFGWEIFISFYFIFVSNLPSDVAFLHAIYRDKEYTQLYEKCMYSTPDQFNFYY